MLFSVRTHTDAVRYDNVLDFWVDGDLNLGSIYQMLSFGEMPSY